VRALIPAFFEQAPHGDETHLSTFQDAPRAAPRVSRAQQDSRWPCRPAPPALERAPPSRAVAASDKQFALDAGRRVRRSAEFDRLLREGARRRVDGYTFYMVRREGRARLGLLVGRREARSAVVRNRIKRRIREAFRLEQAHLGGIDILVRPPQGLRAGPEMVTKLRKLFASLSR
jgi:ribonuclease P protein component